MERRQLKNGYEASLLGYGCMRFPVNKEGHIDEPEAEKLLLHAYNNGVTYFDTAYPYHDGESEKFVGKVMSKLPRDTYYLATKLPCWLVNSTDDAERIFKEQLEHLRTDYVDFYLLHALNIESFRKMRDLGVVEKMEEYKKKGVIKNYGFSFHDSYAAFEEIINYRDWDFCQIQYNYIDKDTQATTKGYDLAKSKGIPLVIMEPVKGGNLSKLPEELAAKLKPYRDITPSAWALNWVGTFDNVKVILSGMTTMEQLVDNLNTFNNFKPLSAEEKSALEGVGDEILARAKNGCTGCRYCMPCPMGINIPKMFFMWNQYHKFNNLEELDRLFNKETPEAEKPYACVRCGKCESACPQHLKIRDDLKAMGDEMKELFN